MRFLIFLLLVSQLPFVSNEAQVLRNHKYWENIYSKNISLIDEFNKTFNGQSSEFDEDMPTVVNKRYWLLLNLFERDSSHNGLDSLSISRFIDDVVSSENSSVSHLDTSFYAHLKVKLLFKKKDTIETEITLEHEITKNGGVKWVISAVEFINSKFKRNKYPKSRNFISPMNHELDFMGLHKVFGGNDTISPYFDSNFKLDQLTIFHQLISQDFLELFLISEINFHYLQIEGWAFRVSYYNKRSTNSGWLIDQLTKFNHNNTKSNYLAKRLNLSKHE